MNSLAPACLLRRESQLRLPRLLSKHCPVVLDSWMRVWASSCLPWLGLHQLQCTGLTWQDQSSSSSNFVYSDDMWHTRVWNSVYLGSLSNSRKHMWSVGPSTTLETNLTSAPGVRKEPENKFFSLPLPPLRTILRLIGRFLTWLAFFLCLNSL